MKLLRVPTACWGLVIAFLEAVAIRGRHREAKNCHCLVGDTIFAMQRRAGGRQSLKSASPCTRTASDGYRRRLRTDTGQPSCHTAQQACDDAEQVVQERYQSGNIAQQIRRGTHEIPERRARCTVQRDTNRIERYLDA
jgi:hypothetical protein